MTYRGERKKGLQILLSYSQAGDRQKTKQDQEEISRNHVPTFFLGSVYVALPLLILPDHPALFSGLVNISGLGTEQKEAINLLL